LRFVRKTARFINRITLAEAGINHWFHANRRKLLSTIDKVNYCRTQRDPMRDSFATWQEIDTALSRLLFIEAEVGLTFAHAAISADSTGECLHNRKLARRAYDNAGKWLARAKLADGDTNALCNRLQTLRRELRRLGDPVNDLRDNPKQLRH
jgi:hypothetical protein